MESVTTDDIPAAILAALGVIPLIFGGGVGIYVGITALTTSSQNGWVDLGLRLAGGAAFIGAFTILVSVWFIKNNEVKLPTAILAGILVLSLFRLIEHIEKPREGYDGALLLPILLVPVLVWVLLWGIERRWNMSFSQ